VQGHLPEPASPAPDVGAPEARSPSPEALVAAAELAAGLDDEELRKQVEKAVALGLSTRADDRSL
jgi:hypothetical protein